jgi:hypothetical protein
MQGGRKPAVGVQVTHFNHPIIMLTKTHKHTHTMKTINEGNHPPSLKESDSQQMGPPSNYRNPHIWRNRKT